MMYLLTLNITDGKPHLSIHDTIRRSYQTGDVSSLVAHSI